MSLSNVKTYFRTQGKAVAWIEHTDGFARDNIPATLKDKSYHIELGTFSAEPASNGDQQIKVPVSVRFFTNGYRNPAEGIDRAVKDSEAFVVECMKTQNRVGGLLKNCVFSQMTVSPLATTNDNVVLVELNFTAIIQLGY